MVVILSLMRSLIIFIIGVYDRNSCSLLTSGDCWLGLTCIFSAFNACSIPFAMASGVKSVIYPLGLPRIWATPQKSVHTIGLPKHKASPSVMQKLSYRDGWT